MLNKKKFWATLGLGGLAAFLLLVCFGAPPIPDFQEHDAAASNEKLVAYTAAVAGVAAGDTPIDRTEVELPRVLDSEYCRGSAIAAYRHYVRFIQSLPTIEERAAELIKPAASILTLPKETRSLLAATDPKEDEIGALGKSGGSNLLQKKLSYFLLSRWTKHALVVGEDLRSVVIESFVTVTTPTLLDADPPLLRFVCAALGHFAAPSDVQSVTHACMSALETARGASKEQYESRLYDSVLDVLVTLAMSQPQEEPEDLQRAINLRTTLLSLLSEPWMTKPRTVAFVTKLTMVGDFADWLPDLQIMLASPESKRRWAAVEAIRIFADLQRATPYQVNSLISDALLRDGDGPTQWAVLELLAEFGGEEGVVRLLAELESPLAADRPALLSFLALKSKLPVEVAEKYLTSKDVQMRNAAIDALGHLGKSNDAALLLLRGLISSTDAEIRLLAVRAFAKTNRADTTTLLATSVRDSDTRVAKEALKQIGRLDTPQPELLRQIATDPSLKGELRAIAFEELLLDSNDQELPGIFETMHRDTDPLVEMNGYVGKASLAFAQGSADAVRAWRELPIPRQLLEQAGALGIFRNGVRAEVEKNVSEMIKALRNPLTQEALAIQQAFRSGTHLRGNSLLGEMYRVPDRMVAYIKGLQ